MNKRLPSPPPEAGEPSNATSAAIPMPDSSSDSSVSYTSDDARRFLQEWRVAKDNYSKETRENNQLEILLEAFQATLLAAEEETNATWGRLAESDAMVVGKMDSKKTSVLFFSTFVLIVSLFL